MTKSLTEKWKDMDLADGHLYYWRMPNGEVRIMNKLGACSYKLCYDGGKIEILAPVPSYDEYKKLKKYEEMVTDDSTTNPMDCMQIEINGLEVQVKKIQEQIEEANEALKYFAETTIGHKQKDGTYGMWLCSGEVAWDNPLERIKSRINYVCYDPRPAKKYLKKWGVK